MLAAGFIYSAAATYRHVRVLLQQARTSGPSASIDAYLAPVNLSSGEELRRSARCLWPSDKDLVLIGDASHLSMQDATQIYYATAYLLYPRRVVLTQRTGLGPVSNPTKTGIGADAVHVKVEDLGSVVHRQ
jgi:hypothetical protein